jgi:hypothetical protein
MANDVLDLFGEEVKLIYANKECVQETIVLEMRDFVRP